MDDKILAGLAGLLTLFVSGAVFDKLHAGSTPIGDRVMCGLLAIPLVAIALRRAYPAISMKWAFVAPAPLLWYIVLLAATAHPNSDTGWRKSVKANFVDWMMFPILAFYAIVAVIVLWTK